MKRAYGLLGIFALIVCASAWQLARVSFHDRLADLLPASLHPALTLFEHSPLHSRLLVGVHAPDEAQARLALQHLQTSLVEAQFLRPPFTPGADFRGQLFNALPFYFTEADARQVSARLNAPSVALQLAQNKEKLLSLGALFEKAHIAQDPLNLADLFAPKWRAFQTGNSLFEDGALLSPDGRTRLGFYESTFDAASFARALAFERAFHAAARQLPAGVHAFFLGAARYTLENVQLITRDLRVVALGACAGLLGVFLLFFRHKKALWVYAVPLAVIAPAACITYGVFGRLNGITLGFGSVCAGLSADYIIYLFFAAQRTHPVRAAKALRHHLVCNFVSSAVCFGALFFSTVEVFRQIAVFGISALLLSLLITLFILPPLLNGLTPPTRVEHAQSGSCGLTRRESAFCMGFLLLFGAWGINHTHFDADLSRLNAFSPALAADRQAARNLLSASTPQALLAVTGHTREEVLQKSEFLSAQLPEPLAVSGVFVSAKSQAQNRARWNDFWTAEKRHYTQLLLEEEGRKQGFQASAFAHFLEGLTHGQPAPPDFTLLYNPFITLPDGTQGVIHIVPDTDLYRQLAREHNAPFVSAAQLQQQISASVRAQAARVFWAAVLLNLVIVSVLLKSVRLTLLAFVPVVLGACVTFGAFALSGAAVNLFALIFLPLLIGLGLDYGLFEVVKYTRENTLYPPRALLAAGCSTLAGFGVLLLAHHPVLHMMGLSALLGIGGALVSAWVLLPPFLEK